MNGTLTTSSPFDRGAIIGIGSGADCELVKVTRCVGAGPYTVAVRRYRWFDRTWDTLRAYWRHLLKPYCEWQYGRCDTRRCLRTAALETDDYDAYCRRHAPEGAR